MPDITKRQQEVLDAIARLLEMYGYPPSVAEVASEIGTTTNGAYDHLRALRKAGKVDWEARKARTLRIL